LLDSKVVSKTHMLILAIINYTFLALDVIFPFIYSVTFAILNTKY